MSKIERLAYSTVIVALSSVLVVRSQAAQGAPESRGEPTSVWGSSEDSKQFAQNLRLRLDDLGDLKGADLIFGWALLMKDFGLVYDGHVMTDIDHMAPAGHGWHVDCSDLSSDSWLIRNNVITSEMVESGTIEGRVVEVPKRTLLRFITESGVSESLPDPAELEHAVLFVGLGPKSMLINLQSGDYYRLPFDRPSATQLDRTAGSLPWTPKYIESASEPSSFW